MPLYPSSYGQNPYYPRSEDFQVVDRNQSVGKGVITYKSFQRGDLIAAINGQLTREVSQHSLQIEPGLHLVDLDFVGYFLHSCDPNVSVDMRNRKVKALKPIQPFDFLVMDYAETEEVLFNQFPCNCGTAKCRGWITGWSEWPNEQNPAFQEFLRSRSIGV